MWPFKRKVHVILVTVSDGTSYLGKDMSLTKDLEKALHFPSARDAKHVVHKWNIYGILAVYARVRR